MSEAIAHDIAHGGDAEVEHIDLANGNTDASEAARLILIAPLSTTPGAIHGLREYQLVDCLQRPGRDLSTFKANVLDKLATRACHCRQSPLLKAKACRRAPGANCWVTPSSRLRCDA